MLRIEQNTFSQTQVKIFYKANDSNFKNLELESISKIVIKEYEYFIKNIDFTVHMFQNCYKRLNQEN